MWMTAAGNAEKIDKAKKILTGAVIGLVIVLSSFAIASFIISRLLEATGADTGGTGNGGDNGSISTSNSTSFYISGTTPQNNQIGVVRNVAVKTFFNKQAQSLTQAGLDNNFRVEKIADIDAGTGAESPVSQVSVSGTAAGASNWHEIDFKASASCGDEKNTANCFPSWSKFRVTVNGGSGILAVGGQSLSCAGSSCQFEFSTNDSIDTGAPTAGIVPTQICKDDGALKADANMVGGWGKDDVGISGINFYEQKQGGAENLVQAAPGDSKTYFYSEWQYATGAMNVGDSYTFRAEVSDMAASSSSASFTTDIKPGHCCNGVKDGSEEDVDCGGSDCLSCSGGTCNISEPNQCSASDISNCSDNLCSTWFCDCKTSGCICEQKPIISGLSPQGGFCSASPDTACIADSDCAGGDTCDTSKPNGAAGNFVTVTGKFFGSVLGKIFFSGASGWIEAKLANDSSSGNSACSDAWSDTQIIAIVPSNAVQGPVKVEAASAYYDESDDASGPVLDDLRINTISRPGICKLDPDHGAMNDTAGYYGIKMSNSLSYFGNTSNKIAGLNSSFTGSKQGTAEVPNLETGKTTSFLLNGKVYSNYINFTKDEEPYAGPYINSFEPTKGREGQYVTIYGGGFGNSKGTSKVYFGDTNGTEASFDFPDICAESVWNDNQIIIKVPEGIADGSYKLTTVVDGNIADTGNISPNVFQVDSSLPLSPSVCKIDPIMGQNNTELSLWGEYFDSQSADSKVRFFSNYDQTGSAISFWGADSSVTSGIKPDKAIATVHAQAATGPVKIVKNSPESAGNGINFTVGSCQSDSDCGGSNVCCPEDSSEAGRCKADADECYVKVNACVYNWDFATGGASATSTIDTPEECSDNSSICCLDAKNGNAITWRAGDKDIISNDTPDLAYCPYYSCDINDSTQCNNTASTSGAYSDLNLCKTDCSGSAAPGTSCNIGTDSSPSCDASICSASYECLLYQTTGQACGNCCCVPGTSNADGLECIADKSPCDGSSRGLFCGCTEDSQCGSVSTSGCGLDTCCRARPAVESVSPAESATDVCRNSAITATFNEQMDPTSFSGNVIVVGDYGLDICPSGTEYVTFLDKPAIIRMADRIISVLAKIPVLNSFLFGREARALTGNFCAISGSISGYNSADKKTSLTFTPSKLLEGGRKYYVVIKGDKNLDGKNGVLNYNDIGMNPMSHESLNSISYDGKIWSFTTRSAQGENNGICKIDHVDISPTSYLFSTTKNDLNENDSDYNDGSFDTVEDSDKVFLAKALDDDNQALVSVSEYSWSWDWTTSKSSVADFTDVSGLDGSKKLIRAKEGVTDDRTTITATANASDGNFSDSAEVYVFTCVNPWPPVGSDGTWEPWMDETDGTECLSGSGTCSNTNYELYYCRDAGDAGTADDLPAILSDDTIIRGSSSSQLKEFYFLRESTPSTTSSLILSDQKTGGEIFASWSPVDGASGYKLYYGSSSGKYSNFSDTGSATSKTISGLDDGQTYYFTVTAYFSSGAESSYADEASIAPSDQTPPAAPSGLKAVSGSSGMDLSWSKNTDDTVKYKVYYGTESGVYGSAKETTSNYYTISGLSSGVTAYCAVTAIDGDGNESVKSSEINFTYN